MLCCQVKKLFENSFLPRQIIHCQGCPVGQIFLRKDICYIILHGSFGNIELGRDLLVGEPFRHRLYYIELAFGISCGIKASRCRRRLCPLRSRASGQCFKDASFHDSGTVIDRLDHLFQMLGCMVLDEIPLTKRLV